VIDRICTTETLQNKQRSGRPRALTEHDERFIVREIKKNPRISAPKLASELERRGTKVCANTIRNTCKKYGYHGRVARKKFWVSNVNRQKRLDFAKKHRFKKEDFWNQVIFSDESKYNIFGSDGRRMVWRKKNTEMQPQNLVPTVKHGGGSVMVWGCMSAAGVGKLHIIEGIMDHKMYIRILKDNLSASAEKLGLQGTYIFQQDNDPKHTAQNTKLWLLYNTPEQLKTPPQSPDMNPIEHLRKVLDDAIRKRHISNKNELKQALKEEWDKIPPSVTANLVSSMPRRLQAVIDAKGNPTKY
jgi:transposase